MTEPNWSKPKLYSKVSFYGPVQKDLDQCKAILNRPVQNHLDLQKDKASDCCSLRNSRMHVFNECVVFKKPSVVFHLRHPVFSFPNCHEFAIWVRDSARCPRLDKGPLKKWTEKLTLNDNQELFW